MSTKSSCGGPTCKVSDPSATFPGLLEAVLVLILSIQHPDTGGDMRCDKWWKDLDDYQMIRDSENWAFWHYYRIQGDMTGTYKLLQGHCLHQVFQYIYIFLKRSITENLQNYNTGMQHLRTGSLSRSYKEDAILLHIIASTITTFKVYCDHSQSQTVIITTTYIMTRTELPYM